MFAMNASSDSPRLKPRVGGATSPIAGTKPLMRYVAGSRDRLAYTPLRITETPGLSALSACGRLEACVAA